MKSNTVESSLLFLRIWDKIIEIKTKNLNWRTSAALKISAFETYCLERHRVLFSSLLNIIDKFFSLVASLGTIHETSISFPKLESWPNYSGQIGKIKLNFFYYLKFSWFFAFSSAIVYFACNCLPLLIASNSKIFLKFPTSLTF